MSNPISICTVGGCKSKIDARGLCRHHYYKAKVAGKFNKSLCNIEGCEKPSYINGLCHKHYNKDRVSRNPPCDVDGCENPSLVKGLCIKHNAQIRNRGKIMHTNYDPNKVIFEGNICKIVLQDKWSDPIGEAVIDRGDYNLVKDYRWCMQKTHSNKYCSTRIKDKTVFIQHVIIGRMWLDHIDRDGLNNRRFNLRNCTQQQNNFNKGLRSDNTTGYKGIFWRCSAWAAQICRSGVHHYLGTFETKEEAALAYNKAAKELFGEFAYLNNVPSEGYKSDIEMRV